MKDFIIDTGKTIINIFASICFLLILISGFCFLVGKDTALIGLAILLGGTIFVCLSLFWVYLVIDLSDNIKLINEKLETLLNYQKIQTQKIIEDREEENRQAEECNKEEE